MTSKRLARLVRLKQLAEQARATELASERQSLADAHQDLAETHARMDAHGDVQGVVTATQLSQIADYQAHLAVQARSQTQVIAGQARLVQTAEVAVQHAWSERRSMESAQDRAADREDAEERRLEQLEMAEIALNRSRRKS